MIAIFGGGEIAERGIVPVVGECRIITQAECDVRDAEAVTTVSLSLGGLSALVFTAGMSRPQAARHSGWQDFRDEVETNLIGAFNVATIGARWFRPIPLIFVASLAGLYGKPNHSGYSASKAGLISLVQSLAMEGHNAYAISPGRVDTAMRERDYPGEDPRTRLDPLVIGHLVKDILDDRYTPGDNLVIRMRGHEVLPVEIHRGDGWRERLKVGEPTTWCAAGTSTSSTDRPGSAGCAVMAGS